MATVKDSLERRILALVKASGKSTLTVVSALRTADPSVSESAARQAVWRLVDRGRLALAANRTLVVSK